MRPNLYRRLGLRKDATPEAIKKAYRRLAMKHHPDRGGDREKFEAIDLAYKVLSDPARRAHFDATGEILKSAGAGSEFADLMERVIMPALTNVLDEMSQRKFKASTHNVLDHVRLMLEARMKQAQNALDVIRQRVEELDTMIERFKVEGERPNLLQGAATQHRVYAQAQINAIKGDLELTARALEFLTHCRYEVARQKYVHPTLAWATFN